MIDYEPCPFRNSSSLADDSQCWHPYADPLAKLHRHSHTWQRGDARFLEISGYVVNMETGEIRGNAQFGTDEIIEANAKGPYYLKPELDPNREANGRRVIRLYGWEIPDNVRIVEIPEEKVPVIMPTVEWFYHGASGWSYGQDDADHNYELSPQGNLKRIYSKVERTRVVDYERRFGATKASRKFDIPVATVRSWVKRADLRLCR